MIVTKYVQPQCRNTKWQYEKEWKEADEDRIREMKEEELLNYLDSDD